MHLKNVLNGKEEKINNNYPLIFYFELTNKLNDLILNDLDLLCITNNIFYIDKEFIKTILEAMLNIKIELNIKSHDYYKFITNDMNDEKIKVY